MGGKNLAGTRSSYKDKQTWIQEIVMNRNYNRSKHEKRDRMHDFSLNLNVFFLFSEDNVRTNGKSKLYILCVNFYE